MPKTPVQESKDDFDPDTYLASESFDPDLYLKRMPQPKMSPVDAAISKFSQGISGGSADEISGVLEASIPGLSDWSKPFGDRYREQRNIHRMRSAQAAHDQPEVAFGSDLAGSATMGMSPLGRSAFLPSKAAGVWKNMAKMMGVGALTGAAGSNTDLTKDTSQVPKFLNDVKNAAALSGLAHMASVPAGYGAAKISPENLHVGSRERAVKAAMGQNRKQYKELSKSGQLVNAGDELFADQSKKGGLLPDQEAGKPILGWFSNAEDLAPKIQARKDAYGKGIEGVSNAVDSLRPEGAINPQAIVADLKEKLGKLSDTVDDEPARKYLQKQIQHYESYTPQSMGAQGPAAPLSFAETQRNKSRIKWNPAEDANRTDARNETKRVLGDAQERAARDLANNPNISNDEAAKLGLYEQLKSKWQAMNSLNQGAQDRVIANKSNRFNSPSDYMAGAAAEVSNAARNNGENIIPGIWGIVAAQANKQVRERGSAFAARTMDKLSQIMQANPAGLNRFRGALERAAKEGPQSLMLTHMLLAEDPEYRQTIEQGSAP